MDVSSLLTDGKPHSSSRQTKVASGHTSADNQSEHRQNYASGSSGTSAMQQNMFNGVSSAGTESHHSRHSSYGGAATKPKNVTFEYLMTEGTQQRARLPMRVNIYPHDGTDSITTTVKNFYGLYDGNGVSFEDKAGNTLIARYENFEDKMTVYVRVADVVESKTGTPSITMSPSRPRLGPAIELAPAGANISRPSSRTARNRSNSPTMRRFQRGQSVSSNSKARAKAAFKARTGSTQGSLAETAMDVDASDSDGEGGASVSSSRRAKIDIVASAEISVENIVEGGRRKRARFDSSELPLFQPSQIPMPGSVSSLSPQRRLGSQPVASPFQHTNSYTFSYNALPSPQSHHQSDMYMHSNTSAVSLNGATYGAGRRFGGSAHYPSRHSYPSANGILPTPDPTIGSVISDEDVARQLMALGDPSNFSYSGARASTSTIDDTLSGKAEVASSAGGSDGSEVDERELPERGRHSEYESEEEYEDRNDTSFKGESDAISPEQMKQGIARVMPVLQHLASTGSSSHSAKAGSKPVKPKSMSQLVSSNGSKKPKTSGSTSNPKNAPMSPASLSAHSRKTSVSQIPLGVDEEDLSSKPRCQRCRKSKKGCDRQRPCGRCRDAGIGIEGCVSEDEGNGRKGRYGRHMGVIVKKGQEGSEGSPHGSANGSHNGHSHSHSHNHIKASGPPPFAEHKPIMGAVGLAMSPPQHHGHHHGGYQHHQQNVSPVHHGHHAQPYPQYNLQYGPPQHQMGQGMGMHPYPQSYTPGTMAAPNFVPDKKGGQKRKR